MNQQVQPNSNTGEEKKNFFQDKEEIFQKSKTKESQNQSKLGKNLESAKKKNILPAKDIINLDKKEIGEINKNKIIESAKQKKKENIENNENKIFGEVDEESQESEEIEENQNIINLYPKKEEEEEKNIIKEKSSLLKANKKINYKILPNKLLSKEKIENDTFCDKFFVVSFSKNYKIIEDSIKYDADCNHEFCKQAYAIEPEIIYQYEKRKDNLEI